MKKVIFISTNLRRGSNSDMLADKFVDGVKSAGNEGLMGWIEHLI